MPQVGALRSSFALQNTLPCSEKTLIIRVRYIAEGQGRCTNTRSGDTLLCVVIAFDSKFGTWVSHCWTPMFLMKLSHKGYQAHGEH